MLLRKKVLPSVLCVGIGLCVVRPVIAQEDRNSGNFQPGFVNSGPGDRPNFASGGAAAGEGEQGRRKHTPEGRIRHQRERISRGISQGTITEEQAKKLRASLDSLEASLNSQRQANGGELKEEQLVQAENSLNQSNDMIKSFESAGSKVVDNGKVLGPTWSTGKDGAQNSGNLLKKMKDENKREQRQYRQAMEQNTEQQQLDYEKQMMQKFQNQRQNIQQQQGDLKNERKETGAD